MKENGFVFEDVLVRRDDVFEYLNEKTLNFRFQQEQTEIEIEDENAVFEDERIVETEDAELRLKMSEKGITTFWECECSAKIH